VDTLAVSIPLKDAKQIVDSTYKWAKEFNVDEKLILAVAKIESKFNKHAISPSGAYGVMQIIPVWHKEKILAARAKLGNPELFHIDTNIFLGTWILKDCLIKTGNTIKALQCYSGQTAGYSQKVMSEYQKL
jgi:soluble lytic murein transglycosylase-like protein